MKKTINNHKSTINNPGGVVDFSINNQQSTINNPYLPYPVRIEEIITETEDKNLKTFKLVFVNPDDEEKFSYQAGQFAELSVAGKGEVPIGIASSPSEKGYLMFTINKVGLVTTALHCMKPGDIMGVRGPLGNSYPWNILKGKNVVIIGGGFAFTTLRSAIVYMLDPVNRPNFRKIHVIYGARSPGMLLYKDELAAWEARDDINMHITVDSTEDPAWKHDKIIMSLEMRMKCGIGMCGRCNIGKEFVCKDGPVFTLAQLNEMPKEY
jgi:NAD(P)H-flavin reductase